MLKSDFATQNDQRLNGLLGLGDTVNCISQAHGQKWSLYHGDSIQVIKGIPDNSVGLGLSSWPFGDQYAYSAKLEDFGNVKDNVEFFEQMDYLIPQMLRVTIPGRLNVVHCKDRIIYGSKSKHGTFHMDRFSDQVGDAMEKHGWLFFGRIVITTDVVAENKSTHRLTNKEMRKDASKMGVGMNEYFMLFRKLPTEGTHSDEPVLVGEAEYNISNWQLDANGHWRSSGDRHLFPWEDPVYDYEKHVSHLQENIQPKRGSGASMLESVPSPDNTWVLANNVDYRRMNVLNGKVVRGEDEKHICPLQLDLIERMIIRYSNSGDVVFDPFAGIGSTVIKAIELDRYGVGVELKDEYFDIGARYCQDKEDELNVPTLFDLKVI